jgi:hypothetical protein
MNGFVSKLTLGCFLVCGCLLAAVSAVAMSPDVDDSIQPTIGRAGELFTIQFTPASRKLTVGLAGKPALTIDSRKVSLLGRVVSDKGEAKSLTIVPVESHFEITDEVPEATPLEFEIKDTKTKKSEKFRLEYRKP